MDPNHPVILQSHAHKLIDAGSMFQDPFLTITILEAPEFYLGSDLRQVLSLLGVHAFDRGNPVEDF